MKQAFFFIIAASMLSTSLGGANAQDRAEIALRLFDEICAAHFPNRAAIAAKASEAGLKPFPMPDVKGLIEDSWSEHPSDLNWVSVTYTHNQNLEISDCTVATQGDFDRVKREIGGRSYLGPETAKSKEVTEFYQIDDPSKQARVWSFKGDPRTTITVHTLRDMTPPYIHITLVRHPPPRG
jgi:hypothetical protein